MVQVHFTVVLTLNDTPHAVVASCFGLAVWYPESLQYTDTQRIDADEKEDQGNPRGIEDFFQSSNPFAAGSVIGLRHTPCPSCPLQFVLPLDHFGSLKRGRSGWTRSILCASRGRTEARISHFMHGHLSSAEFRCVNRQPASSFTHVTMASSLSKSLGTHNSGYPTAKIAWFRSGLPPSRFGRRVELCIFPAPARYFPSFDYLKMGATIGDLFKPSRESLPQRSFSEVTIARSHHRFLIGLAFIFSTRFASGLTGSAQEFGREGD